jgi:Transcriptional regulatory protein, C terminal
MAPMDCRSAGSAVVGRDVELSVLLRVLEEHGPRVCFVYGIAGMGKSSLLAKFGEECERLGIGVLTVDCRSIEPTEQGFLGGLASAVDPTTTITSTADLAALPDGRRTVVLIDTYEVFRIADPWLRHELLPALGPEVRVVVAGREPPMLEWAVERGQLGGLEVLPLGRLDEDSVQTIVRSAGVEDGPAASAIVRVSRGHPLALRLALEARLAGGVTPEADAMPQVVDALAGAFRDGLDEGARRALDAAAVPRRITRGVLAAMLDDGAADEALEMLSRLAFVEATSEGLRLHDAVQSAIVERLRALDPERFRRYRAAAWHYLQTETTGVARHELDRTTSDLLFLIDNPVVREAMFPTTVHAYSVEPARIEDMSELRSLWHRHDPPEAHALDLWLERVPGAVGAIRDRSGALVGCSIVAEWCDIPHSLERDDPVMGAYSQHAALHPLPNGQRTLVVRRALARDTGEGPSGVQAAGWLDCKRHYFEMRPQLGRTYTGIADPTPFADALAVLGFQFLEPVSFADDSYHPAALDFGPESVDGWLSRLAAAELGIADRGFLDPEDRTVDLGEQRIQLSPLEFGVLATLSERPGRAVTRAEPIKRVWGTTYVGGSNVVDVVVRNLRQKLGPIANRVETARGVGYRLK